MVDNFWAYNWYQYGFNLTNINEIKFTSKIPTKVPSLYKGYFNVDEVADTYLNSTGFVKGVPFINGNGIGRYWLKDPQLTLNVH